MQYFLISDNVDTQIGMRMAGIRGIIAHNKEEADDAIDAAVADPQIGILLITEKLAVLCQEKIAPLKANSRTPLVVEIPNRESAGRTPDSITRYIREAIGIKL